MTKTYAEYKKIAKEKKNKHHSLADVFAAKHRAGGQALSPKTKALKGKAAEMHKKALNY